MPGSKLTYHFEEAKNREELDEISRGLVQQGWNVVGEPRSMELIFPNGRHAWHFTQTYARPALYPACERVRGSLAPPLRRLGHRLNRCEHLVHFYENDDVFLRILEAFVLAGLMNGEAVAVIALPEHRRDLALRLLRAGVDFEACMLSRQLLLLDAEATLGTFLRDGMPDQLLFTQTIANAVRPLRARYPTVRAFGEMVGILWANGNGEATIRLEELWHRHCQREDLALLCAYRRDEFRAGSAEALQRICAAHTQTIPAELGSGIAGLHRVERVAGNIDDR